MKKIDWLDLKYQFRNLRWISKAIDAAWWVRYRTTNRNHVIYCDGLRPGYHEIEDQMLHSMFGLLRSYVEDQCAHIQRRSQEAPLVGTPRELGLVYLEWASNLKDAEVQSHSAKEAKALYLWWVDERPNRPDPYDASGYSEIHAKHRDEPMFVPLNDGSGLSKMRPLHEEEEAALHLSNEIEERYHDEDEEMMRRLIAIRRSLWT